VTRIAVVADSHFCETSRFEECIRLHDEIAEWVETHRPDAVVHAGDIFERRSTPRERVAVANWLQRVAAVCPVAVVRGNHDAEEDVAFMARLQSARGIHAVERPDIVTVREVDLLLLPWPRKSVLLAAMPGASMEEADEAAKFALRSVLLGLRGESTAPHRLLVSHAMVRGSMTSHGQPLVGMEMELGLEDLALAECNAYALGHIHMQQRWDVGGAPAFYPGSPRRTAFGEVEEKGFVVVDVEARSTEFVRLSATPMVLVETEWVPEHIGLPGDVVVPAAMAEVPVPPLGGAEVRFRYRVGADQREAARSAAAAWRDTALLEGAVNVKVEEVVDATTRARAPEVAQARTLREQLEAYWATKGKDPGERRVALLDKVSLLENSHAS
jgi:exonuclease SbcD